MAHFDGNRAAGPLAQAFGRDVTDAAVVCAFCGLRHVLAESYVYDRAPGIVMRCPACRNVELVIVEMRTEVRISLRGLRYLDLAEVASDRIGDERLRNVQP